MWQFTSLKPVLFSIQQIKLVAECYIQWVFVIRAFIWYYKWIFLSKTGNICRITLSLCDILGYRSRVVEQLTEIWFRLDWWTGINVSDIFAVSIFRVNLVRPPSRRRLHVSMKHWYSGMYINLQSIKRHNIAIFTFLCAPFLHLYEEVVSEAKSESRRWTDCRIVERHPVSGKK